MSARALTCAVACLWALGASADGRWHHRFSLQSGFEYDTNVFKNFNAPVSDFLFRAVAKDAGQLDLGPATRLFWNAQAGGKKYFRRDEQDLAILSLELPLRQRLGDRLILTFAPEVKYQNESDGTDAVGADINEDFYTAAGLLSLEAALPAGFSVTGFANLSYFHFAQTLNFSYVRDAFGGRVAREVNDWLSVYAQYAYAAQRFTDSARADREHAVTPGVRIQKYVVFSGSYTYQRVDSNNDIFSFQNHRADLALSVPLLHRSADAPDSMLSLHLLGTLQFRDYPSVFGSTQEGERFLLSGAEDDNFDSLTAKLVYRPTDAWSFEGKYTRYSNDLSTAEVTFDRNLFYLGSRYEF